MAIWVRAGLVGAAFSGAPSTAIALVRGNDVLASTEAVGAALISGAAGRPARLITGGAAHVLISLTWAAVLARVLRRPLSRPGATRVHGAVAGALCGLGIAALDLGLIGRRLPAIRSLATGPQLADHVTFGALVGWTLTGG
ncbi:MAG: hypothetical protein KY395_08035 [Actinobacteria bacterium]|nr:hypothetical protein [Actinomycetota bacterium]